MIYLASPYSHLVPAIEAERYDAACAIVAHFTPKTLHPIFSPIVYWHPLARKHGLPGDAGYWRRFNFGMLRQAKELWVLRLEGWEESKGVREELSIARTLMIPTSHLDPNGAFVL